MFSWFRKRVQLPLPFCTDIHCHLIPGVDDGSQTVEDSVDMLSHMQQWGITSIVPTSHATEDTFENTPAIIDPAYGSLVAGAREAGLSIDILSPSCEYRMDNFFIQCLENNIVRPLPGNYLLVENSYTVEAWDIDQLIFDLSLKGFKPVLAHPERYRYYHGKPERYKALHDNGVFMQCNVLSLAGYYGKEIRNVALWMVDNDLVDFLGTDMHGSRHVQAIEDFMTTKSFDRLSRKLKDRLLNDKMELI